MFLALIAHFGAHLGIAIGLARRQPRWHAAIGFVVPPLGVWWARRAKMRALVITWAVSLVVYVCALVALRV